MYYALVDLLLVWFMFVLLVVWFLYICSSKGAKLIFNDTHVSLVQNWHAASKFGID